MWSSGTPYSVSSARTSGHVAGLAQLVDPAGAEAKLGSHQQQILHCSSAVYQSVVLIPLCRK